MQSTTNYSMNLVEGADLVNIPVQLNPNFQTVDAEMFKNKQAGVGTATEVVTGTVHAVVRSNTDADMFRFTSTGAWTAGDTMTLDGSAVTVHLADGTAPATGAYIIGAEVVAVVNGTLVTLLTSAAQPVAGVTSFNSRTGAVSPAASDYDASMIDYDNTLSGITATDLQSAVDEINDKTETLIWTNSNPLLTFDAQALNIDPTNKYRGYKIDFGQVVSGQFMHYGELEIDNGDNAIMTYFDITGGGNVYSQTRKLSAASGTITFEDSKTNILTSYGSAPTQSIANTANIPYHIYGIK